MDAKKAAKIIKPKRLYDTKANFVLNLVSVGVVVFSVAATYFASEWISAHPQRFLKRNKVAQYFQSDDFQLSRSVWLGLAPPASSLQEKYHRPIENIARNSPGEK